MYVGIYKLTIRLPENHDLKGKRRVIHSLCDRLRQRFNVAVAEVSENDLWQLATIGVACISNNSRHLQAMISSISNFILEQTGEFEIIKEYQEIMSGF